MNVLRVALLSLLSLGTSLSSAQAADAAFSEQHLWIGDKLVIAGSLDLGALKSEHSGSVLVVDLRTAAEGVAAEQAEAEALGMSYRNIPVNGTAILDEQVAALDAALSDASSESLVVLHCASGNRAGMLWAASQIRHGRDLEDVLEQVAPVVTKAPATDALRAYAARLETPR
jgi:uncharacterized protein (TIGR01244 family)